MKDNRKRLTVRLAPPVWARLREEMFKRDEKANVLVERALTKFLPVRLEK